MSKYLPLFYAGALLFAIPLVVAGDDAKKGAEVDGVWKLTKYIENGTPRNDIVEQNYLLVREDGVQTITKDGKLFSKRKFEIDPTKTPKHIDFIDDKGAREGGVYEIKGDEMRVAILADAEKRKTKRPGDLKEEGNIVAVYKRVKNK